MDWPLPALKQRPLALPGAATGPPNWLIPEHMILIAKNFNQYLARNIFESYISHRQLSLRTRNYRNTNPALPTRAKPPPPPAGPPPVCFLRFLFCDNFLCAN